MKLNLNFMDSHHSLSLSSGKTFTVPKVTSISVQEIHNCPELTGHTTAAPEPDIFSTPNPGAPRDRLGFPGSLPTGDPHGKERYIKTVKQGRMPRKGENNTISSESGRKGYLDTWETKSKHFKNHKETKKILNTARKKQLPSVAGKLMPTPNNAHFLSSGTCEMLGYMARELGSRWR